MSNPTPPATLPEKLPDPVKLVLDADQKQAEAVGIVMALFAGALVSLAQIVEGVGSEDPKTTTASWQAMRVFLYGSVMLNLGGAFLSLLTIKMCTDLPLAYHQSTDKEGKNIKLPHGVEPQYRFGLLLKAGMSRHYATVDHMSTMALILACMCTFASLTFWVCLNTPSAITSGLTMIIFGLVGLGAISAFVMTSLGEGWK
ncbi:hypothetical protein M408DRAFT_28135 [Serendipita vermifera MAFF 305830]|uniref:Uncharacterized protein n=1 Tax=Serendipita vermifera MAFF 305830 TaxID=933852 RepID=A0A0C3AV72_SERVB|nr:hypothetical protein M408DRAFT_28135 [Serendipita vermifera MAFF 305830]